MKAKENMQVKCVNCAEYTRCKDNFAAWVFFIIGIIATVAIRLVTVLINVHPIYGKVAWYIGVSGFFLFFIYKFRIYRERRDLIEKANLVQKLSKKAQLTENDYNTISSILCALRSRKELINYIFIFVLSALALMLAVYFDFIR